jgi:hypothetical protein
MPSWSGKWWVLRTSFPTGEGITLKVKSSQQPAVLVRANGEGLVGHAGRRLPAELAERSGLEAELSMALAPMAQGLRRHDPGRVRVDLAVTLVDGGKCISDLAALRQQPELLGQVPSTPTAGRGLDSIDERMLAQLTAAMAEARARVWEWTVP